MGLLKDDDEKSVVGQVYDGLVSMLSNASKQMYPSETYKSGEAFAMDMVDKGWSSLNKLGVSENVLYGNPTTTQDDFSKSLGNTIFNLPSQVPRVTKDVLSVGFNPVDTGVGLFNLIEGAGTNAADVFYDTLTPKKYEEAFKEFRSKGQSEQSEINEGIASAMGGLIVDKLSTKQGRRDVFQQYGLEGLIGLSVLPKSFLKLSKVQQQQALASFFEGVDPEKIINQMTAPLTLSGKGILGEMKSEFIGGEIAAQRLGKTAELNKAKQLQSEGVDAETIWKQTGFALAQDGNWRFEIDDSGASLKDISEYPMDMNTSIKAEDYINHPEIFKSYPELAQLDVYPFNFKLPPSTFGYYAQKAGIPEIQMNPVSRKTLEEHGQIKRGELDPKVLAFGKFSHELQHAGQAIEGNTGGTSQAMEAGKVFVEENLPDLRAEITNIDLQMNALSGSNSGSDLRILGELYDRKRELEKQLVDQDQYISDKGYENYLKTLGEKEAFQTQKDISLTAEERANRLPAYLLDEDARIDDSALQLGVDDGLLGASVSAPLMKSSDFKRRKDGTYVGFSKSINTPQKLNKLIEQIDRMATEGADARMWYEDSSNQILNLVNGDKVEAEKLAQIIAITSQGASVATNTSFAFKAYMQHKAGMPIEAGRFPAAQSKKIVDVLNGIPWEGRKTNSFYENLMVEIDPTKVTQNTTTQDMWMARAFGLDSEVPGSGQYEVMEKITQSIATKNGWRPHQAQAAVWVAVKARNDAMKSVINAEVKKKGWGNNANDIFPENQKKFDKFYQTTVYDSEYNLDEFLKASYSFADGIEDNLGYINLEAVPGTTTSFLQGIKNAKPEEVAAYTKDMYSIFLDENGVDLLAKEIGIVSPGNFLGFGGWKGDINPNVQVQGILSGTQASGINAADIALVETYAAVVGTIFRQDGVSYRRAFADKTVGNQNAVDIDIGRQLTKEENERLYAELTKQFGNDYVSPTSNSSGADIINYTPFDDSVPTVSNADFKKMVKQAIIDADLGEVELGYYRSEGNLLTNDWKENPNGESYKNRENLTGNAQEIYERMVDKFGKEADKINARYAEEYGW